VSGAAASEPVERQVHIAADRDTVFDFFTDAEKMVCWIGRAAELDPRPGGVFRCDINGRDVASGRYLEVDRPARVVFTWGWESAVDLRPAPGLSTVEVTLEEVADGTVVRLVHRGLETPDVRLTHRRGWEHYFERLEIVAVGKDAGPDPWAEVAGGDA
jgi:uncharacterized protein YndB with AHSA1/START domain